MVEKFTYLDSTPSVYRYGWRGEHQTHKRECSLWPTQSECVETKRHLRGNQIKVNRAVVLTTLLYGCETWTTYQRHIKLNHFHTTCLRKILSITGQKHIHDTEVLTLASLPGIYTILMQSQLRWTGHVSIKDCHLSKKLLYGKLSLSKRSQRGQKKRFKDTQKVSM